MIKAIYEYRNYIVNNAVGELKYRYAGSSLGFFWNILNPILQIIVYTFVFSEIMQAKMEALNGTAGFSLYLCAGMFAWLSFNECIARGTNTFNECSSFLKKLSVPEYVFIAQKSLSSFLSCLINYCIIFVYSIIITGKVSWCWIEVPFILILMMLFGFGLAMLLATANVFLKDIAQVVNVLLMIWMWVTPIVYVKTILPEEFYKLIEINPIYPFIYSLQQIIVFGEQVQAESILKMIVIAGISIIIGYIFTKKNISEIRDLI